MANVHILDYDGPRLRFVFHVPIPNVNNPRGVNYRTALTQLGRYGTTILPDGDGTNGTISAAEKAGIASRAVVEVVHVVKRPQATNAALDALFAQAQAETQAGIQAELADYGVTRTA